ncbi:MAG: tetratricopeptide repeat protein [Proteobacteria bacterium]|nr:tetratricopeptide repeat protein [Pseudomonadota bacterium]
MSNKKINFIEWFKNKRSFVLQSVKGFVRLASTECIFGLTWYHVFFIGSLLMSGFYYFVRLPIVPLDTDLWYHLNSGRYILETNSLPRNNFFSFISPERPWTDYFWLFQVLVFKVYDVSGYYGLIAVRALLYLGVALIVFFYMTRVPRTANSDIYILTCFVLYFLFLQGRFHIIRPHMFTYLFILSTIYIIEFRLRKATYILPFLIVLWGNLHGIEYPVLLLIVFAYVAEFIITHINSKTIPARREVLYHAVIAVSPTFLLLNPYGISLLRVPFVATDYASLYITELRAIPVQDLFSLKVFSGMSADLTVFNLLLLLVVVAFLTCLVKRQIRVSHFIMCVCGIYLMQRGLRFQYEFALLSLPLLMDNFPRITFPRSDRWKQVMYILGISLITVLPFVVMKHGLRVLPQYPVSHINLPRGIAAFLNQVSVGGNVLNHPNNGGYLQWMLYPKCKIFMDMEVPFLFTDKDMFAALNLFSSKPVLKKVLDKYNPSFITVPQHNREFRTVISGFPQYRPVFFDEAEILYINRDLLPELAVAYELRAVDPWEFPGRKMESIAKAPDRNEIVKEITRLLEVYPDGLLTNQLMGEICSSEGNYRQALKHADTIIKNFPEVSVGYSLKAASLHKLNMPSEAMDNLQLALLRANNEEKRRIYKQMSLISIEKRLYRRAYEYAGEAINPFASDTNPVELYQLGSTAFLAGKKKKAVEILKMGYTKISESDIEWKTKYEKLFIELNVNDKIEDW